MYTLPTIAISSDVHCHDLASARGCTKIADVLPLSWGEGDGIQEIAKMSQRAQGPGVCRS